MAIKGFEDMIKLSLKNRLNDGFCVGESMGLSIGVESAEAFTQKRWKKVGPGRGPLSQLITI
jgi:hypothetical protein